jgi:hypothetical protein
MMLISKWKFRWNKEAFDPSPAKIRGIGSRENAMEHIPYQLNHSSHSKISHKSIGLWQAVCKKLRPFKVDWCLCAWNSPRNEWFWFEVPKQYSNTPKLWDESLHLIEIRQLGCLSRPFVCALKRFKFDGSTVLEPLGNESKKGYPKILPKMNGRG